MIVSTDEDTTAALPNRPEFQRLVHDLRALVKEQASGALAKADFARRNANNVMAKAMAAFDEGKITGHDLSVLHALRMRLDLALPAWERS